MVNEGIDEEAKRQAYERVKQIVKAIKALKIKYYLNFSKMSEKDKETYQKLEAQLDKVSDNDVNDLKVTLMSEVNDRYDDKNFDDSENGNEKNPDDILKACYGAIDAQAEALSKGKITQALRCQEQLKKYMQVVELPNYKEMIINYKREKFAELGLERGQVAEQMKSWENKMKGMYKIKDVSKRKDTMEVVTNAQTNTKENEETIKTEEVVI